MGYSIVMNLSYPNLDDLAEEIHATAVTKGFWDKFSEYPELHTDLLLAKLCLIDSEVAEVLESIRKSKGEREVMLEVADILIRTLDFAAGLRDIGYTNLSLQDILVEKMNFNTERPPMHGVLA